jgi:DNA-directed RNA polymerase subunit RPC12/RpoP
MPPPRSDDSPGSPTESASDAGPVPDAPNTTQRSQASAVPIATQKTLPSERPGNVVSDSMARTFPCSECGARLEFNIGVQNLKCPFCGHEEAIVLTEEDLIQEQDLNAMLERESERRIQNSKDKQNAKDKQNSEDQDAADPIAAGYQEVQCDRCGGTVVFTGTLTSTSCPYCAGPIQLDKAHTCTLRIPVDGVMPFLVERDQARKNLQTWVKSLWWAPNDFIRQGVEGKFQGVYLPFWTFDANTDTYYSGWRGVNVTYTYTTTENGQTVTKTATRTDWYPASGRFDRFFDDVVISASKGLPAPLLESLSPWPFQDRLQPFTHQFLAGFLARTYDIELKDGFQSGKARMEASLRSDVCSRIGGDHQRIDVMKVKWSNLTYKHLLLPTWLLAYRYRDRPYQVAINAATGEVQGERPYSWIKITAAIVTVLAIIGVIIVLANQ